MKFTTTTTGGDSAVTEDGSTCTSTVPLVARITGVGTGTGVGLAARNPDVASSGQAFRSPRVELEAHAFVSGADTTFLVDFQILTTTGGSYTASFTRKIGAGAEASPLGFTNSTAGQFVGGVIAQSGFVSYSTQVIAICDVDNSGLFRGGSGGLQLISRAAGDLSLWRSPTTPGSTAAFRMYAIGGDWTSSQVVLEIGDNASAFARIWALFGDGVAAARGVRTTGWNIRNVAAADSPVTAAIGDWILTDTTAGAITINLPAVPSSASPRSVDIRVTDKGNAAVNNITVTPAAGDLINDGASLTISTNNTSRDLSHTGDGTNWRLV